MTNNDVFATLPKLRLPALLEGELQYLDLTSFMGQWLVFCCLSEFSPGDMMILARQDARLHHAGAKFLVLFPSPTSLHTIRRTQASLCRFPLLADPSERLIRALRIVPPLPADRVQTVIVEPAGKIRYHLTHSLNARGMEFMAEIFNYCRQHFTAETRPSQWPAGRFSYDPETKLLVCSEPSTIIHATHSDKRNRLMTTHHNSHPMKWTKLNICDCGRLHLTYGVVTLHFTRKEFVDFAGLISQLAAHLPSILPATRPYETRSTSTDQDSLLCC
ncbi:MAG: hypothetical protein D6704_04175 [Nitrospirae bacterium]|nr:MAG: hypothetical protein D6704_04175 [Nitrospirota bacterium]